jgi:hypothetical protein
MSDFNELNKQSEKYYETQKNILEVAKRNVRSLSDYVDAQKKVKQNAKEIREIDKQISILEKSTTKEAKAKAEELKKQKDLLVGVNKELLKASSLAKAYMNEFTGANGEKVGQALMSIRSKVIGIGKSYFDMDSAVRKVSVGMGMSVNMMNNFRQESTKAQEGLADMGYDVKASAEMMSSFADQTGRQVMLSKESQVEMGRLALRTGMAHGEMAGLVGQMDAFGLGSVNALENITSMVESNEKMGVNSGKVIKKFQQNLGLVNKLSFKGGIKGMMKMAAFSEKYKISMEGVAAVAEKVFRPEGAIEAAATLQTLGGSLSQLGDPFQLMYQARHAPEELMKSISRASVASAKFNEKTGEFELGALELDRMREASKALGLNMEELVATAKQTAKMDMFGKALKVDKNSEAAEYLTSIAEMKDGKAVVFTGEYDDKNMKKYVNLSDITTEQAKKMSDQAKTNQQAAEMSQSSMERLQNMFNSFLASFYEPIKELDDKVIRNLINDVVKPLLDWGKGLAKFFVDNPLLTKIVAGLVLFGPILTKIFSPLAWYIKGRSLGWGFNSVAAGNSKGGLLSGLTDKFKGMFGKKGGPTDVIGSQTTPTVGRDPKTGRFTSLKGSSPTTTSVGGDVAGKGGGMSSFKNSLGSAVQILAVGAALMMLAKAIEILAKAALIIKENNLGATMAALGAGLLIFIGVLSLILPVGPLVAGVLIGLGAGLLLMGAAVAIAAYGMSLLVDSFTNMFSVISGDELMKSGAGFLLLSAGIGVLALSLIGLSSASFLAVPGLLMLGSITAMMVGTAMALEKANFGTMVSDLNSLDTEKLKTLREIVALSSKGKPIKIEFSDLSIDGEIDIKGESGGKKSTEWLNDPIFVRKLKSMIMESMEKDKKGGR